MTLFQQKFVGMVAGKMVQWLKNLPHSHEDQNLWKCQVRCGTLERQSRALQSKLTRETSLILIVSLVIPLGLIEQLWVSSGFD